MCGWPFSRRAGMLSMTHGESCRRDEEPGCHDARAMSCAVDSARLGVVVAVDLTAHNREPGPRRDEASIRRKRVAACSAAMWAHPAIARSARTLRAGSTSRGDSCRSLSIAALAQTPGAAPVVRDVRAHWRVAPGRRPANDHSNPPLVAGGRGRRVAGHAFGQGQHSAMRVRAPEPIASLPIFIDPCCAR